MDARFSGHAIQEFAESIAMRMFGGTGWDVCSGVLARVSDQDARRD